MPVPLDLRPVSPVAPLRGSDSLTDPRQEAFQRALAPLLGKTVQGEVLARLGANQYLVSIAGTPTRVALPGGADVGAGLPLTLVALTPRPTFDIGAGAAGTRTLIQPEAVLARAVAAPGAPLAPPAAADSNPAHLSETARVLGGVLASALAAPSPQRAIVRAAPLLASADAEGAHIAATLRDAIATSGLFYESHVAEWAAGQRPLADLLREPQMQSAMAAGVAEKTAAPDPAAAQLINLQLTTQEQARLVWQGQPWPGVQMEWELEKQDTPGAAQEAPEPVWRSGLRLRFAQLGEIDATVVLCGTRLHIQMQPAISATAALLRGRAEALESALGASGNPLSSLDIGRSCREQDD